MISDPYKLIFVHINKTGGTSIEKVFDPLADRQDVPFKHQPLAFYRDRFPAQFRDYFKFSIVRNPWDWLVSRFYWSRDHQRLIDYSFRELVRRLQHRIPLSAAAPWMEGALAPQLDRLSIDGRLGVDLVGRFESLQRDFETICRIVGMTPVTLPHVFKTDHGSYTECYDRETRAIVERLYADDIAAFGYRFGDGVA
jgi:chondroitin 4-sulfotransferase 11